MSASSTPSSRIVDSRAPGRRIAILDIYRGLTIFYIVAVVHPLFWIHTSVPAPLSWLMLEMPVLFALAGYAFGLSSGAAGMPWGRYFINRLDRLLIPVVLYVAACAMLAVADNIGSIRSIADALHAAAWWLPDRFHPRQPRPPFLAWHLWFLPVMLLVSAVLPAFNLVRKPERWMPLLIVWLSAFCLLALGSTLVHLPSTLAHSILYAAWAYTGLAWKRGWQPRPNQLLGISAGAALALGAGWWLGLWTLNMQTNKFPASVPFLLFSLCVMPLVCSAAPASAGLLMKLGQSSLLKPYVRYSYSCYLWQPVGFLLFHRLAARPLLSYPALRAALSAPMALTLTALLVSLVGRLEHFTFLKRVRAAKGQASLPKPVT